MPTLPNSIGSNTLGVFEGRTPCRDFLEVFTKFTVTSDQGCERVKWLVTFYQDESGNPTRYVYGIQGREESHGGRWTIKKGIPSNPDAIVYQLYPDDDRQTISFLKVGEDHLFFVDENLNLLVGNKLLSYTLSRTSDSYENRKSGL